MATFQGIKAGDRVTFWDYAGLGRAGMEYRRNLGRAQGLLVFADHVVVTTGGRRGTPVVVDAGNYISHRSTTR